MAKKVVYNHKPDPIVSIEEYKVDSNGKLVLVKSQKTLTQAVKDFDKEQAALDHAFFKKEVK
tara:strand:+ start:26685 stop:26870 length:186 start_codon:yes stop_codon:yes gene_type:complete